MKAFVFPGQGSQFPGMCKDLYDAHSEAREMCQAANRLLGFSLTDIMFEGSDEDLRQTKVTQPAIFLHSVVAQRLMTIERPDMVAGHSLGEFSALVACGALRFEDALLLVYARAQAMQAACEANPGTMAAVLGLPDEQVDAICQAHKGGVVVAANFNCPGQIVISGESEAIDAICQVFQEAGCRSISRRHQQNGVPQTLLSDLSERDSKTLYRTRDYPRKPACATYKPRSLDAIRSKHDRRWRYRVLRVRSRRCPQRPDPEDQSRGAGGIMARKL